MGDGHSGISNAKVNEGGSGGYQLTLAYLKEGNGSANFIMHATSNTAYSVDPFQFLLEIGFTQYKGECPFYHERCCYRILGGFDRDDEGYGYRQETQAIHSAFKEFASKLGELYEFRQKQAQILRNIGQEVPGHSIFASPVMIKVLEAEIPLWIDEVKFKKLKELEADQAKIKKEVEGLIKFLPLVYGTGESLEEAVTQALRLFGLDAEKAPKGFTADIMADSADKKLRFGIEVTGISGAIKKDSIKLTQVSEFERIKENNEKTILLANTHNTLPISKRKGLENFTRQVLDYFSRHPILMMTGWDMYCLVSDRLEGKKTKEEIVALLFDTTSELNYGKDRS